MPDWRWPDLPLYGALVVKHRLSASVFSTCSVFRLGGGCRRPAPIDSHESGGGGPSTAGCARTRQSEASLPEVATIAPQPCIRWMLEEVILEHPNHDAAMRIGGEAPRRRAHSLPRHESHGHGRATATSDRLGVTARLGGETPNLSNFVSAPMLFRPNHSQIAAGRSLAPAGTSPVVT
jgi:hypothetical protein